MLQIKTDYVVIGSGLAGLATALWASSYGRVLVLSKDKLDHCNSTLAQGGMAAAVGHGDSPQLHAEDTLFAGAGICDPVVVDILTQEAIQIVEDLIELGTRFDLSPSGELALAREGAHRLARVLHHGDLTGAEIWRALYERIQQIELIKLMPEYRAEDLLISEGSCSGVIARGKQGRVKIFARGVVLATGGCGQIFGRTTSSLLSWGDGIALAWRAGAVLNDLEFIQFHPTALDTGDSPLFLISEAVRGEGAVLVTETGERFMTKVHPMADLAPRDVVSRAIVREQEKGHRVYLDATGIGVLFSSRFPNIYTKLNAEGLDPVKDWIPVTPAAHFTIGGVKTDAWGRTRIKGLFACGEVASTGVHGANRLASNSLLEALVFGKRVAFELARRKGHKGSFEEQKYPAHSLEAQESRAHGYDEYTLSELKDKKNLCESLFDHSEEIKELSLDDPRLKELQELMWTHVGIVRSAEGLSRALQGLNVLKEKVADHEIELRDRILVAELITKAALRREESRGSHYRIDYPEPSTLWQSKHISLGKFTA